MPTIENQAANLILLPFLVLALYLVWVDLAIPCMRESMRSRVFILRCEMFREMAKGGISSTHTAYELLRDKMNLAMRCARGITLSRAIVGLLVMDDRCQAATEQLDKAILSLPGDSRAQMESYRRRLSAAVGWFMLQRSMLFWILAVVFCPIMIVMLLVVRSAKATCSKALSKMALRPAEWGVRSIECIEEEELADAA